MVTNSTIKLPKTYSCKVLPWGIGATIAITMYIGLSVMFIGIWLNAPVWLLVVLLLGTMYFILSKLSSFATFTLTTDSLSRTLTTTNFLFRDKAEKTYQWKDIKNYKEGMDKGRFRGEYQYLEIRFKDGNEWTLSDNYGIQTADYSEFLQAFVNKVNEYNQLALSSSTAPAEQSINNPEAKPIVRKKTIYESVWGKIFTIALGLFILYIVKYWSDYLSATSLFRVAIILIPGFLYMAYRVFIKEK